MPTGYTAPVQSGEIKDFPTFALRCARAFGALVEMRDDPPDAPIRQAEVGDYHSKAIQAAKAEIERLYALSMEERAAEQQRAWEERHAYITEWDRTRAVQSDRYRAMLEKVLAWSPPTSDHDGLKDFMVKQLRESIDLDCSGSYHPQNDVPLRQEEWWRNAVQKATGDLAYHEEELAKEQKRVEERNEWVRQLRASLLNPEPTP